MGVIAVALKLFYTWCNTRGGQGQARVIQEVTNCVVIKNQSQYSLTDLESPPCELSNDVRINLLGHSLQEIRVFPHILSNTRGHADRKAAHSGLQCKLRLGRGLRSVRFRCGPCGKARPTFSATHA